jgi:psiF repeat-containing protein
MKLSTLFAAAIALALPVGAAIAQTAPAAPTAPKAPTTTTTTQPTMTQKVQDTTKVATDKTVKTARKLKAKAKSLIKTAKARTEASLQCSKDADAKGVHGKPRKSFMAKCKAAAKKKM